MSTGEAGLLLRQVAGLRADLCGYLQRESGPCECKRLSAWMHQRGDSGGEGEVRALACLERAVESLSQTEAAGWQRGRILSRCWTASQPHD